MCVYSMVIDKALQWPSEWWKNPVVPSIFDDLVKGAKKYDEKTGQPNCELGININFD